MFGPKTYTMVCHACGKIYDVQATFMSSPLAWSYELPKGSEFCSVSIPCRACTECQEANKGLKREETTIYKAFIGKPTPEARQRFHDEFPKRFPQYFKN